MQMRVLNLGLCACLLASCNYHKLRQPAPNVPVPENLQARQVEESKEIAQKKPDRNYDTRWRWWLTFQDPALNALIDEALSDNLQVRSGWANVRQARAMSHQARAALFPQINLQGSASRSKTLNPFFGTNENTTVTGSLPVQYELDFFARRAREFQAGKLDARASSLDQRALLISTSAEIAEAWYDVVDVEARRNVLEEQRRTNQELLELVELRYRQGLTAAVDVHQQRSLVAQTKGQLALVDGQRDIAAQSLALLLGDPPTRGFGTSEVALPTLPEQPVIPASADLLEQRPDVHAAMRRVEASDRRAAAAVGARLPQVTLSYSPSYTYLKNTSEGFSSDMMMPAGSVTSETDGFEWNVSAQLSMPIFDGLLGRAQVRANRAAFDALMEQYTQVVLTALVEVETARILEVYQTINIANLEEQLRLAQATLEAARDRYRGGLSDFLPVLNALNTKQSTELALLSARRQLISHRIQLHRALGGDWPKQLEDPKQ